MSIKQEPKIALITGATSGIGKEIALGLARAGFTLLIPCRNKQKGQTALEQLKNAGANSVELFIVDLSSQESIHLLAKEIHVRVPHLDLLINNAGSVFTQRRMSVDNIEMTLATNYLGPFLLTQLMIDLLKNSSNPRVINISSAAHTWGTIDLNDLLYESRKYQFLKVYAQSKLLLNIASFESARRLKNQGITINCIHPGAVKTNLGANNAQGTLSKLLEKTIKFFFISPKRAAKPILDLALSPKFSKVTGQYFSKDKAKRSLKIAYDLEFAQQVWEKSELLIKPKFGS
jgi:NAD(P)-dependent dehydrogenase (short-subunit alcohol dehydrogenase family)